jgi:hypothetical protein
VIQYISRGESLIKRKLNLTQERVKIGGFNGSPRKKSKVRITDFDIIKPISKGAYGRVFLVKKKKTQGTLFMLTFKTSLQ